MDEREKNTELKPEGLETVRERVTGMVEKNSSKPAPEETKSYIVFNREAVNPKSLDQYEASAHQKGATVIRVKTRE